MACATAYYLASKYGLRDIAVLERGWIGGGNTGLCRYGPARCLNP